MPKIDTILQKMAEQPESTPTTVVQDKDDLAIQVDNLNFSFGGPLILDNLNLRIEPGSRCLLVGANGAGKSTLLRILAGKRLTQGDVYVLGKRAFVDRPEKVLYLGTEWVSNPATKLDLQVNKLLQSVGGDLVPERRDRLVRMLDVDLQWRMHQVSDGERRRVQLVMGLLQDWSVLLLDEVTVDLDVMVRSNLFQFLHKETQERNATILYATHIFDGLGNWPTQVAHIHKGSILDVFPINPINHIEPTSSAKQEPPAFTGTVPQQVFDRLSQFEELLDAVKQCQTQLHNGIVIDSPLLKVVEKWLRQDFLDRLKSGDVRSHKNLPTKWDELKEDVDTYGDKYYNYWL